MSDGHRWHSYIVAFRKNYELPDAPNKRLCQHVFGKAFSSRALVNIRRPSKIGQACRMAPTQGPTISSG